MEQYMMNILGPVSVPKVKGHENRWSIQKVHVNAAEGSFCIIFKNSKILISLTLFSTLD